MCVVPVVLDTLSVAIEECVCVCALMVVVGTVCAYAYSLKMRLIMK